MNRTFEDSIEELLELWARSVEALPDFDRAVLKAKLQARVPQGPETDVIQ